jgi:hypothetical protein
VPGRTPATPRGHNRMPSAGDQPPTAVEARRWSDARTHGPAHPLRPLSDYGSHGPPTVAESPAGPRGIGLRPPGSCTVAQPRTLALGCCAVRSGRGRRTRALSRARSQPRGLLLGILRVLRLDRPLVDLIVELRPGTRATFDRRIPDARTAEVAAHEPARLSPHASDPPKGGLPGSRGSHRGLQSSAPG